MSSSPTAVPVPNPHLSAPLHKSNAKSAHEKLVAATRKWVAMSFFEPVLKQARENPYHNNRFSGGKGAEAFGSMQDEFMAERMTRGTGSKLVNAIVNRIEAKAAYARHKTTRINEEREGADRVKPAAAASSVKNIVPQE